MWLSIVHHSIFDDHDKFEVTGHHFALSKRNVMELIHAYDIMIHIQMYTLFDNDALL